MQFKDGPCPKSCTAGEKTVGEKYRGGESYSKKTLPNRESRVISIITLLLPGHTAGLGSQHKPVSDRLIDKRVFTAHQQMQSLLLLPHQAHAVSDRVSKTKFLLLMSAIIIQQIR